MDVAQAQLSKYSDQLALWSRIDADLAPPTQLSQSFNVDVDPAYLAAMTDTDGDGVLSPAEIAAGTPGCSTMIRFVSLDCPLRSTSCAQIQRRQH